MASIPSPKFYVSVDARCKDNGAIVPIRVVWPDGRTFGIAEVVGEPAANAPEGADERTLRYTVRVGSSVTHLFLERKRVDRGFDMRWYVIPKRNAQSCPSPFGTFRNGNRPRGYISGSRAGCERRSRMAGFHYSGDCLNFVDKYGDCWESACNRAMTKLFAELKEVVGESADGVDLYCGTLATAVGYAGYYKSVDDAKLAYLAGVYRNLFDGSDPQDEEAVTEALARVVSEGALDHAEADDALMSEAFAERAASGIDDIATYVRKSWIEEQSTRKPDPVAVSSEARRSAERCAFDRSESIRKAKTL